MSNIDLEELKDFSVNETFNVENIKNELEPLVHQLFDLKTKEEDVKAHLSHLEDTMLKPVKKEINEIKMKIYSLWSPYIQGTSKSNLNIGDLDLTSKETLNIKINSKDEVISWLSENGYKDVMTWDINSNTAKKILREEAEKGVELDSVEYNRFTLIDVKPKKGK